MQPLLVGCADASREVGFLCALLWLFWGDCKILLLKGASRSGLAGLQTQSKITRSTTFPPKKVLMAAHQALEALIDATPAAAMLEVLRLKLPSAEAVHRCADARVRLPCPLLLPCCRSTLSSASSMTNQPRSGTAVDGDVLCAAIRCVQRAAARVPPADLMALAPAGLLPGLFAAFQHPRPDVRKVVVFCIVDVWLHVGERCGRRARRGGGVLPLAGRLLVALVCLSPSLNSSCNPPTQPSTHAA